MNVKKIIVTSLTMALLTSPIVNLESVSAKTTKITQTVKEKDLSTKEALELAAKLANISNQVQAGGTYQEGEYKTFAYKGKTYRYLASNLDKRKELTGFIKGALTHSAAEQLIKDMGIIEYKGKMAQPEADGGSLLQWTKASAEFFKEVQNTKYYRMTVPVGNTEVKEVFIVEYRFVDKIGWKISKQPYWDLDIPFNINPVQNLFHNLLRNPENAQQQFINPTIMNVNEFRKGIKKAELVELKEVNRTKTQVEYMAKINVELEAGYKGSLSNGVNQLFFLIQPVDEMEFKIVNYGTGKQLVK